jgi:glycosyltransferase involved in cell wall biosynthesis
MTAEHMMTSRSTSDMESDPNAGLSPIAGLRAEHEHLQDAVTRLRREAAETRFELFRTRRELERAIERGLEFERRYRDILASSTWRAMEPIRGLLRSLRRQRKLAVVDPYFSVPVEDRLAEPVQSKRHRPSFTSDPILALRGLLWGGQAEFAQNQLDNIVKNSPDVRLQALAALDLAIWYEFQGRPDRAEALLEGMEGLPEEYAGGLRRQMLRAGLALKQELPDRARELLDSIALDLRDSNFELARANLANNDGERLERINALLQRKGLVPLRLRDPSRPLRLDNIEGSAPVCVLPNMGLVSVIMPAYGAEDTIEMAIRSVCEQTYRNLEIIVVDDCSPDSTFDIACRLAERDSRILPIRRKENGGAYPARNRGLALARGDFITTHDADDWSHPQKLERQLEWFGQREALIGVSSHWARVRSDLMVTSNWRLSHNLIHWNHSSFLFRREASDLLGGWDDVRVSADTEFIWRIEAAYGQRAVKRMMADVPLSFGLDDDSSLTRMKASHISTIYHGLRHYYREISRYWHEQAPDGMSEDQRALKMAMIPRELIHRDCPPQDLDLWLRGDCADPAVIAEMERLAESHGAIGVSHIPCPAIDRRRSNDGHQFCDAFFDFLKRTKVSIVLPGSDPRAGKILDIFDRANNHDHKKQGEEKIP